MQKLTTINLGSCQSLKKIGTYAFSRCDRLSEVYIEDLNKWYEIEFGETSELGRSTANPLCNGAYLFVNGKILTTLTIPEGMTEIKDYRFVNCQSLINVIFPETLISIGEYAFQQCRSLKTVDFSKCKYLESLEDRAFAYCSSLTEINLSNTTQLSYIGKGCFEYCTNLENANLTNCTSLRYIDEYCFLKAQNLISVEFTGCQNLTYIEHAAFYECYKLAVINFSDCQNLTRIKESAFNYCKNIQQVIFPDIEQWLKLDFENFDANPISFYSKDTEPELLIGGECVENIVIPENLDEIKPYVFYGYAHLKSVKFNEHLISIGEYAFSGCQNITDLNFRECLNLENINTSALDYLNSLLELDLSPCVNLKILDSYAFKSCSSLRIIYLPAQLKRIGASTFYSCSNLKYVISLAEIPPVCSKAIFSGIMETEGILFVPNETVGLYRGFKGWEDVYEIKPLEDFIKAESIRFNENTIQLERFNKRNLELFTEPENSILIWDTNWSSSDATIASVNNLGEVYGYKPRKVNITAVSGSYCAQCEVEIVGINVREITLNEHLMELSPGEIAYLWVSDYSPLNADNVNITWNNMDSNIVSVISENSSRLTIKAVSPGETEIVAQCGEAMDKCKIQVMEIPIEKLELNKEFVELTKGEELKLEATILPKNATNKTLTWHSSESGVATVNEQGLVTAVSPGTAVITVSDAYGHNAMVTVTVKEIPVWAESIVIEPTEVVGKHGDSGEFSVIIYPEGSEFTYIHWSSSDDEIVVVDNEGHYVIGGKEGNALVTATVYTGPDSEIQLSASCNISATQVTPDLEIIWNQTFENIAGDTVELVATASNPDHKVCFRHLNPVPGYWGAPLYEENGKWYTHFENSGPYMLEAYIADYPEISSVKTFNVLDNSDVMYIDGLYYSYIDASKSTLKVVRGYKQYRGDYIIPAEAIGLPVKKLDAFAFYGSLQLDNIVISEGIEYLGLSSLANGSLKSVEISSSVSGFGGYVFVENYGNLQDIFIKAIVPPNLDDSHFDVETYETCTLHVPNGSLSAYASAPVWQNFKNIIEGLDSPDTSDIVDISWKEGCSVFTITGLLLIKDASREDIDALRPGIYIIGGKKVVVR